jgi:predicted ester cyclase
MSKHKELIASYLNELSGNPKPPTVVDKYVSDASLAKHIAEVEDAFPRYELIAEDMIEEDDKVAVRATFRGVHGGPFAGIPVTGRSVSAGLIIIYEVSGGKITRHWMQFDLYSLLNQLK